MALDDCPQVYMKCPHKTIGCSDASAAQCHYVLKSRSVAALTLTQFKLMGFRLRPDTEQALARIGERTENNLLELLEDALRPRQR